MQRADKLDFVKDLNSVLKKTDFLMVAHYQGLTVSEISNLRGQIKTANSKFKVTKHTFTIGSIWNSSFKKFSVETHKFVFFVVFFFVFLRDQVLFESN